MNARWPSFSIVVPTFQRREVVCDAVRAIAGLDYVGGIELIVVIDGSSDRSREALVEIDCPFPFQVFEQANAGAAAARNAGAALARGEILLFLDDDMMCEPDLLSRHAESYAQGADAVRGPMPLEEGSAPGFLSAGTAAWADAERRAGEIGACLRPWQIFTGQLSVRRSVFEELGGFDARFTRDGQFGGEDIDFGVKLLERHKVLYNTQAITWQRFVVTPRQYMERAFKAAKADILFERKHPAVAAETFELHGALRPRVRTLARLIGRVPFLPRLCAELAVRVAERALEGKQPNHPAVQRLFRGASSIAYWSVLRSISGIPKGGRALVLCYHVLQEEQISPGFAPYAVTPERLAEQLDALAARGCAFIKPRDLLTCLRHGVGLPPRAVLITFDDCYAALLPVVREILHPRGIPALAFAVSGRSTNEWDSKHGFPQLALLNSLQLAKLHAMGCEIGCHSRTHRKMPDLTAEELADETRKAADELEAQGLPRPVFFAFPHGASDARAMRAVSNAGFAAAFGLRPGRVTRRSPRFDLPRVEIRGGDIGWRFNVRTRWPRLSEWLG